MTAALADPVVDRAVAGDDAAFTVLVERLLHVADADAAR